MKLTRRQLLLTALFGKPLLEAAVKLEPKIAVDIESTIHPAYTGPIFVVDSVTEAWKHYMGKVILHGERYGIGAKRLEGIIRKGREEFKLPAYNYQEIERVLVEYHIGLASTRKITLVETWPNKRQGGDI